MRRTLNRDRDKERKLSVAVYRAAQSGALHSLCSSLPRRALAADLPAPAPIPPPAYAASGL